MMPRSLSQTGPEKRRFSWPKGTPQIIALLLVLLVDSLVAPHFYQVVLQDGRLFGSPIDILNRAAPVALLAIGMTLVIATGGIDLSVGAVMAIAGATAASMTVAGHSLAVVVLASLGAGALAGLWNGILVAILKIQPFVATLILMVAGRGVAQLITAGQIVTFDSPALAWLGSGSFLLFPTPVIIAAATLLLFWLFTRKTALGMFIEAVGINIRAAKNAGVNTRIVVMLAYVLSGVCAAIAGIIVAADIRGADANNAGLWLETGRHSGGGHRRRLPDGRALQPAAVGGGGADYPGNEYRHFAFWFSAGAQPGGESGGGAVRTDCPVAALYRFTERGTRP